MKFFSLVSSFIIFFLPILDGQKVDSIKAEQTGNYIKIRYEIIDSRPDQIFRVRVLCSINGGLNTELKSISGDAGEQVIGGKPEYWVVWDVLKDVEEISSVDFIIRAELVKELNATSNSLIMPPTVEWDKKRFNVLFALLGSGPKVGVRIGYMGSFGVSLQFVQGKTEKGDAPNISPQGDNPAFSIDITKRIINRNRFQMHLMSGLQNTTLIFLQTRESTGPVYKEMVPGFEAGVLCGVSKISFGVGLAHHDPGKIEKEKNVIAVSPLNYITLAFGMRF